MSFLIIDRSREIGYARIPLLLKLSHRILKMGMRTPDLFLNKIGTFF